MLIRLTPWSLSGGSGDWLFDGTNLKRIPSRTEFVGIDRVSRFEVVYVHVPDGTPSH